MCNGYLSSALDADDTHRPTGHHNGGIIIPAAMAIAEATGASGDKFLKSLIIGYEMAYRAGIASRVETTYYGSAYAGAFGAAAASAWLLGLTPAQVVNALGVAEMHAPNCMLMGWIDVRLIPMVKEGMGWAAPSGMMAAYLAKECITGTLTIFNGKEESSRLLQLGEVYELEGLSHKPYPGCRWTHAPLQNIQSIMKEHNLKGDDVTEVRVSTFDKAACLDNVRPATIEDAQYSIPFILGAFMTDGCFGPEQIRQERLGDPAILNHACKVKVEVDPELNKHYPAKIISNVTISTTDGRSYTRRNDTLWGNKEDPLSDQNLFDKFAIMTAGRMTRNQSEKIASAVWSLNDMEKASDLVTRVHNAAGAST